ARVADDAGGFHDRREPAELGDRLPDDGLGRVGGGHVRLERQAAASRRPHLLSHLVKRRRLTADGNDGPAVASKAYGGRAADAARRARHHNRVHSWVVAQLEQLSVVSDKEIGRIATDRPANGRHTDGTAFARKGDL